MADSILDNVEAMLKSTHSYLTKLREELVFLQSRYPQVNFKVEEVDEMVVKTSQAICDLDRLKILVR